MILVTSFKQELISNSSFRWGSSFAFVVCVLSSAVLAAKYWSVSSPITPRPPMAAMMIDLAPMPVAPETPPSEVATDSVQAETPPPEPLPELDIEPLLELPVVEEAEVLLPKKLPKEPDLVEEEPVIEEQIAQQESASPTFEAPPDEVAAAPMDGAVSLAPSQALATWQSALLGHLEHYKRYPLEARHNKQEAVTYVRITINHDGTVVDYRLTQPSAYKALNQETLALIARAQPLPPPPPGISGDTVAFVVPVEFFLRR